MTVANSTPSVGVTLSSLNPATDDTLTATATPSDADGDTVALGYVWSVDGEVVSGATSATFDLSVAGHGDRGQIVAVAVTPSDGSTSGTATSASATVANSVPVATVVLSPATPATDATLTATVTASDADGDQVALTYVWKNGATVVQTTGPTSASGDELDLAVSGNGDAGDVISVTVTPNDGLADGTDATDAVGIDNQAPIVDTASISPTDPTTNQTLTATATAHDPDGGEPTIAYQWTRNGNDIAGATTSTLDLSVAGHGDRGDVIAVRVTASDGALTGDPLTSDGVTVANSAPSATVSLAPDPAGTAGMLTATATATDADPGDAITLTYVWTVDGTTVRTTPASSALTDTLDLGVAGNGDPGQTVQVTVTPSDGSVAGTQVSDSASVEAKALTLNGTSQYVTFGDAPGLNASTFTLETWFRWTGGGAGANTGTGGIASAIPLITKGRAEAEVPADVNMNYFFGIDSTSHVLVADFEDTVDGTNHPVSGQTAVTTNAWHHAAVTYDGTTWKVYLDGIFDRTLILTGNRTPQATSIQHAALGSALTSTGTTGTQPGFFAGSLDEARIWNVARTGSQIRAAKDSPLGGTPAGLIGRWALDEGTGPTANDAAGSTDGTLVGSPTWVTGYGFTPDAAAPATPAGLTAAPGDTSATVTWTANGESDLAGYDLYRSLTSPVATTGTPLNGGDLLRTTTFSDSGLVNGTAYHYALVAVDGSGNRSGAAETTVTLTVPNRGLTFNGTNQYVTFGAAPGLNASTFTLETWFRWTGGGGGTSTGSGGIANAIPLITKGRAEAETPANVNMDYFLGIDATTGVLVADFEDSATGLNHPVSGLTTISPNAWHHAAVTYDGTTWRLYLDGVLDVRETEGAFSPEATSIQHAALATAMTSSGVAAGFFAGSLDEARIWNVARTGSQIRAAKDSPLGGTPAGLIGRWALDEGTGPTANDAAGSTDGTLVGSPTWVTGYGFTPDAAAPATPAGLHGRARRHERDRDLDRQRRERSRRLRPLSLADQPGRHDRHAAQRRRPPPDDDVQRQRPRQRHRVPLCPRRGRRLRQPLGRRRDDGDAGAQRRADRYARRSGRWLDRDDDLADADRQRSRSRGEQRHGVVLRPPVRQRRLRPHRFQRGRLVRGELLCRLVRSRRRPALRVVRRRERWREHRDELHLDPVHRPRGRPGVRRSGRHCRLRPNPGRGLRSGAHRRGRHGLDNRRQRLRQRHRDRVRELLRPGLGHGPIPNPSDAGQP